MVTDYTINHANGEIAIFIDQYSGREYVRDSIVKSYTIADILKHLDDTAYKVLRVDGTAGKVEDISEEVAKAYLKDEDGNYQEGDRFPPIVEQAECFDGWVQEEIEEAGSGDYDRLGAADYGVGRFGR